MTPVDVDVAELHVFIAADDVGQRHDGDPLVVRVGRQVVGQTIEQELVVPQEFSLDLADLGVSEHVERGAFAGT